MEQNHLSDGGLKFHQDLLISNSFMFSQKYHGCIYEGITPSLSPIEDSRLIHADKETSWTSRLLVLHVYRFELASLKSG